MNYNCRNLVPSWEESIILNEDYEYLKNERDKIILFFEVLDFVSSVHQLNKKDHIDGWHNIAFAFLKLSGKGSVFNAGKKIRLQLYQFNHNKKSEPHICSVWKFWKKQKLRKYPSTLYVTIKPIVSPKTVTEAFCIKTPIQRRTATSSRKLILENIKQGESHHLKTLDSEESQNIQSQSEPMWSKTLNEKCKLPNKCKAKLDSGDEGCFVMKFSNNGLFLACALQKNNSACIVVYSVRSMTEVDEFSAQQKFIYCISWSRNDELIISASSDNTISIFNAVTSSVCQILPHPSYVYSCDINEKNAIISGCYDGIVRIWITTEKNKKHKFHLFQELEGHTGYITCVIFSKKSNIFSADSTGIIIEWQKDDDDWKLKREIHILDLKETVINQVIMCPKEKKLLVYSRDDMLRIIDIKSGCILQWLRGAVNKRVQSFATISPCGTFVYSGSEKGLIHIWDSKTGLEVAYCKPYLFDNVLFVINCVTHHPLDNIIAISHYEKNCPILLYCFDENIQQPEIDITIKETALDSSHRQDKKNLNIDNLKNFVRTKQIENSLNEIVYDKNVLPKMDAVVNVNHSEEIL